MLVERHLGQLPREWDDYVARARTATPYHASGWRDVIHATYGHRSFYLTAHEGETVAGVLPLFLVKGFRSKSLVSLPFITYGGICADSDEVAEALVDEAKRIRAEVGADFVELRHTPAQRLELPTATEKVSMVLPLNDTEEETWDALRSVVRNRVNKARKTGVEVETGGSELIPEFYSVFCENMRDLGSPVHSESFFSNMLEYVPDQIRLFCARFEGAPTGGAVAVVFRDSMELPWVSTSYRFRKTGANNALYWAAIADACGRGIRRFDFGRSTPGSGTHEYKRRWGAEEVELAWQFVSPSNEAFGSATSGAAFQLASKVWQRLPVGVTRVVGPTLRRRIAL